jgi:hypothetical protein
MALCDGGLRDGGLRDGGLRDGDGCPLFRQQRRTHGLSGIA